MKKKPKLQQMISKNEQIKEGGGSPLKSAKGDEEKKEARKKG